MDVARITEILIDCLSSLDADGQPEAGCEIVDVWLEICLNTEKVHRYKDEMIELLWEWPSESWGQVVPPLSAEINYLVAGAVLGDQQHAFMLFAFGKVLEWWIIRDPQTMLGFGKDNPMAQQLFGRGMVAIAGYQPLIDAYRASKS